MAGNRCEPVLDPRGLAQELSNKLLIDGAMMPAAGLVQVNQNLVVQAGMSYGGVKQSGLGKEASLEAMLEHFTHKKTIILNLG